MAVQNNINNLDLKEKIILTIGFIVVGIAIAVTTISYALNMEFIYQWLVWMITAAFAGVALISLEWPRSLYRETGVYRIPCRCYLRFNRQRNGWFQSCYKSGRAY